MCTSASMSRISRQAGENRLIRLIYSAIQATVYPEFEGEIDARPTAGTP